MEPLLNQDDKQMLPVKVEAPEEMNHVVVLDVPDSSYKKEEIQEVVISEEEKQLCVKEESSAANVPVSTTSINNDEEMLPVKVEAPEEANHGGVLQVAESSYKKEEMEEVVISEEEKQFCAMEESSAANVPVSTTSINSYEGRTGHSHSWGRYMGERLITAVEKHRVIYDNSYIYYRDRYQKDHAWKSISEETGLPVEFCRRKWKSLRDTYLKDRKVEREKRSGSAPGSGRKWKFSAVMQFLDPFLPPRETISNMGGVEARTSGDSLPDDQEQPSQAAAQSDTEEPTDCEPRQPSPVAHPASPVPAPAAPAVATAAAPTVPQRRRASRRLRDLTQNGPSEVGKAILESRKRPRLLSPAEHYLLGLAPALERVPPDRIEIVKFEVHRIIFENIPTVINGTIGP